jgi:recombination protein RecT
MATIRPASTVIVVSPQSASLASLYKVLMLRRSTKASFMPGAFVFPGGAVDSADSDPQWAQHAPNVPASDLPFRVAAARELFEEAGLLVVRDRNGILNYAPAAFADWRKKVRTALESTLASRPSAALG